MTFDVKLCPYYNQHVEVVDENKEEFTYTDDKVYFVDSEDVADYIRKQINGDENGSNE